MNSREIVSLYFNTINNALKSGTSIENIFKAKNQKNSKAYLDAFIDASEKGFLPTLTIINASKQLFDKSDFDAIVNMAEHPPSLGSLDIFNYEEPLINLYYSRLIDTIPNLKFTKNNNIRWSRLRNYMIEELEIEPDDAKRITKNIQNSLKKAQLPSAEACIMTSDLFSKEEAAEIIYAVNRTKQMNETDDDNYKINSQIISDDSIGYAISKRNKEKARTLKKVSNNTLMSRINKIEQLWRPL